MPGRIKKVGLVEGSGYALIEVRRIQDCVSSAAILHRCHCSKNGVVFVISVKTGEVLDFVVKSMTCHECCEKYTKN